MAISLVTTLTAITSAWANSVANWINARTPVFATATDTTTATTAETKDTTISDITISVSDATAWYRVTYSVKFNVTASSLAGIRVRDGGASSPTTSSTMVGSAQAVVSVTGGPGQTTVAAVSLRQFTVGTHTLAGFYVALTGSGVSVSAPDGSNGVARFLSVEQIT